MFSVTTGYKSQFGIVGSRFARKKRTLYVGLTLRECLLLLPKDVSDYILEYLNTSNLFAMDRATKLNIRNAIYLDYNLQTDVYANVFPINMSKIWRMNKEELVEYVASSNYPIEYWLFKLAFRTVIHSLNHRARLIRIKEEKARKIAIKKRREELQTIVTKSYMHIGCIIQLHKSSIEIGIVTSHRNKSVTMYVANDLTHIDGALNLTLTGKMKVVPYKHVRVSDYDLLDNSIIALSANYKTAELTEDEWSNSKTLLKRIKELI